jgi:hypothetical protein
VLGQLCDRLVRWAAERRRFAGVFVLFGWALVIVALVRLPRPVDFAADLPRAHPIAVARGLAASAPVVRVVVSPVTASNREEVLLQLAADLGQQPGVVGWRTPSLVGRGTAALAQRFVDGIERNGLALAGPTPTLDETRALVARVGGSSVPAAQQLTAELDALRADGGRALSGASVTRALRAVVVGPDPSEGAAVPETDAVEIWLRLEPGTHPARTAALVEQGTVAIRALGLKVESHSLNALLGRFGSGPRTWGIAWLLPVALGAVLAMVLGFGLAGAGALCVAVVACMCVPLLGLLGSRWGLDPGAAWGACLVAAALTGLGVTFLGSRPLRDAATSEYRRTRESLRETAQAVFGVAVLLATAAVATRHSSAGAAWVFAGGAVAAPLFWGAILPAVWLAVPENRRKAPRPLAHGVVAPPRRHLLGGILIGLSAAALLFLPLPEFSVRASHAPKSAPSDVPLLRAVPVDEVGPTSIALRGAEGVVRVLVPASEGHAESVVGACARLAPHLAVPTEAALENAPALPDDLEGTAPAAVDRRVYLGEAAVRSAWLELRREAKRVAEACRPRADEAASKAFHTLDGNQTLVAIATNGTSPPDVVVNPLDGWAPARTSAQVGPWGWVATGLGLAFFALGLLVVAGGRAAVGVMAAALAAIPPWRVAATVGLAPSNLGAAGAWAAAIATAGFVSLAARGRTGFVPSPGLRRAVGIIWMIGLATSAWVLYDTPFREAAFAACVSFGLALALLLVAY